MMNTQSASRTVGGLAAGRATVLIRDTAGVDPLVRAERHQRIGQWMIIAGFVVTVLGVVGYCLASFAGGMNAGVSEILFANAVPFARATLVTLGLGTALWLVGSVMYLHGLMTADELTVRQSGRAESN